MNILSEWKKIVICWEDNILYTNSNVKQYDRFCMKEFWRVLKKIVRIDELYRNEEREKYLKKMK